MARVMDAAMVRIAVIVWDRPAALSESLSSCHHATHVCDHGGVLDDEWRLFQLLEDRGVVTRQQADRLGNLGTVLDQAAEGLEDARAVHAQTRQVTTWGDFALGVCGVPAPAPIVGTSMGVGVATARLRVQGYGNAAAVVGTRLTATIRSAMSASTTPEDP